MVKHEAGYNYVRPGRLKKYSDWILPLVVFVGAMALYLKTMAQSIYWGDSAAFAASNFILGLPHSPSFPLYTLLGRVFNLAPNLSPAFASNLMSAFFAALSVAIFFVLIQRLAETPVLQSARNRIMLGSKKIDFGNENLADETIMVETDSISKPAIVIIPCLAATMLFAVSLPVWLSAVRAEVYSLNLFMILLATLLTFRGITIAKSRPFLLGVWIYALSFANHPLLSLAFAPAFAYLIFVYFHNVGYRPAVLGVIGLAFVLSFSIYFYLPIRSALEPPINWGRPSGIESFFAAITRSSDMVNLAQMTVAPDYVDRLRKIGLFSAGQIGWPLIGITLIGFVGMYKISRKIFLYFPLAFIANLGVIIWAADFSPRNYDLVNYLAPLYAILLITSVAGVLYLMRYRVAALQSSIAITALLGTFIYLSYPKNRAAADISRLDGPEVMIGQALKNIPSGSIIIAAEDDLLLPLWYSAYVDSTAKNYRIISAGGMMNPQYRKQLTINYPDVVFPPDFSEEIPASAESLTVQLCRFNAPNRDVYLQFGAPGVDFSRIEPFGVMFKYMPTNMEPKVDKEGYRAHLDLSEALLKNSPTDLPTCEFVGRWLFNAAVYYDKLGQPEIAWQLFNKALTADRGNIDMRIRLAAALARAGKLKEALQYISQALEIDPNDKNSLELGRHIVKALERQRPVASHD
jgi:hypothetical protein